MHSPGPSITACMSVRSASFMVLKIRNSHNNFDGEATFNLHFYSLQMFSRERLHLLGYLSYDLWVVVLQIRHLHESHGRGKGEKIEDYFDGLKRKTSERKMGRSRKNLFEAL
jgi:hypothetical protein